MRNAWSSFCSADKRSSSVDCMSQAMVDPCERSFGRSECSELWSFAGLQPEMFGTFDCPSQQRYLRVWNVAIYINTSFRQNALLIYLRAFHLGKPRSHWLYLDAVTEIRPSCVAFVEVDNSRWVLAAASFVMDCTASTNFTPILAVIFSVAIFRRQSRPNVTGALYPESRSMIPATSVMIVAVLYP